jgi:predicted Zn-dependent protease
MRLDTVKVAAGQTLGAYLTSGWIENVDPASVQDVAIGGFPATTASAKGEEWAYRLYAMRFGGHVYRFIYAAKTMTPAADQTFRDSVGSFRRLSVSEIEGAKPLRIKIITVRSGSTVDSLARHHMANLDHAIQRFRVINGLATGDQVKPGDQVKIIVE